MDRARARLILAGALAAMALVGNALRAGERAPRPTLRLESIAAGGEFVEESLASDFLDVLQAREVLYRTYGADSDAPLWVFLGYFDRQKEGSQVHSPRHCYPGSGWNIEAEPVWPAPWDGGAVRSLVVHDGTERRLVVYWFQMQGRIETDVMPLKLALAREALRRRPQDVVFASLSTPVTSDLAEAMERIAPVARVVRLEVDRLYRERNESDARDQ